MGGTGCGSWGTFHPYGVRNVKDRGVDSGEWETRD
jgi:hypothetical protein